MATKVKVFWTKEPRDLQKSMNKWLKSKPDIKVIHITQSQVQHGQAGPMPITVCIWYTETKYS